MDAGPGDVDPVVFVPIGFVGIHLPVTAGQDGQDQDGQRRKQGFDVHSFHNQ